MTASYAATPTRSQLDELRRSFAGEILTPDVAGYEDARRVWNAMFERRPALVVRPTKVDDGLVIDMGRMNAVTVDPARQLATTGGGALLGQLDTAAQEHALVCPVGVVGHTGVAGLTLGG